MTTPRPAQPPAGPQVPTLTREQFLAAFPKVWRPEQHTTLIGPTRRGKSTLLAELLPRLDVDRIALLTPKGPDRAYAKVGRPTASWPPKLGWSGALLELLGLTPRPSDRPDMWRLEHPIRSEADWARQQVLFRKALASLLRRKEASKDSLLVVVEDTRVIVDPRMLGLSTLVVQNILIGGSKNTTVFNSFQAPRWVPRECTDQIAHFICWRQRDIDVAKRLSEIGGQDPKELLPLMANLGLRDFLWIDGVNDRVYRVDGLLPAPATQPR